MFRQSIEGENQAVIIERITIMVETRDGDEEPADSQLGCFMIGLIVVAVLCGVFWLVTGAIDIPHKDIHLKGWPARLLAILWILCSSFPMLFRLRKMK